MPLSGLANRHPCLDGPPAQLPTCPRPDLCPYWQSVGLPIVVGIAMAQGLADWELYAKGDHLPIAVKVALAMGPGAASSLVGGGCPALTVGDAEGAALR